MNIISGIFGLAAAFIGLVLASGIGALLALRMFVYSELGLTKNEVRTAVKHLSYERASGDE
ncbi:hypothetical protein [Haladaptatus halobius]|uniref:hypothetical protein n=1 Tax=Haladaptatus halobius TaxID=2884875 RepID=UPI001D0AED4E|nr:hypothetical protein [Haladaptatus halobius]